MKNRKWMIRPRNKVTLWSVLIQASIDCDFESTQERRSGSHWKPNWQLVWKGSLAAYACRCLQGTTVGEKKSGWLKMVPPLMIITVTPTHIRQSFKKKVDHFWWFLPWYLLLDVYEASRPSACFSISWTALLVASIGPTFAPARGPWICPARHLSLGAKPGGRWRDEGNLEEATQKRWEKRIIEWLGREI